MCRILTLHLTLRSSKVIRQSSCLLRYFEKTFVLKTLLRIKCRTKSCNRPPNGKGRRCCLGAEFIQFLAAQVFCTRLIWRKGWGAKQLARQGIECILSSKEQRRPLLSLLYNFFFYNSMVMTDQETRLRRRLHLSIDWYSFYDQKV